MEEALRAKGGACYAEEELRGKGKAQPRPLRSPFSLVVWFGRSAELRVHWLFDSEEPGSGKRPDQAGSWGPRCPPGLWLRRPGLRHWAREDGAGWLPSKLLTSLRPGSFVAGKSASAALCLSEPLVQRYRDAESHIRWRHQPGVRGCFELGIWRPQLSSHPLLLPVSYPVVERGGDGDRARGVWVSCWGEKERGAALFFFPDSPAEDLIVYKREVNIMTGLSLLSPMQGKTLCVGSRFFGTQKKEN